MSPTDTNATEAPPSGHHRVVNETLFCDASVLFLLKGSFMIVQTFLQIAFFNQESFILPQIVAPFFYHGSYHLFSTIERMSFLCLIRHA